jgi:hypothetical protein
MRELLLVPVVLTAIVGSHVREASRLQNRLAPNGQDEINDSYTGTVASCSGGLCFIN